MTSIIKRIATRWTLPALVLIAGGFVCDGLTEVGHHALLIAGGIAIPMPRFCGSRFDSSALGPDVLKDECGGSVNQAAADAELRWFLTSKSFAIVTTWSGSKPNFL
jgi:hypothetical protein